MSSADTPENSPENGGESQRMTPNSSPATGRIPISLEYLLPTVYKPDSVPSKTPKSSKSTKMADEKYNEQFPVMPSSPMFPPPKGAKSKSLTDAELKSVMMKPAEVDQLAEDLKNSEPPMSLEQTRKRRATIKEGRKANIDFIKARTARRISRAAEAVPGIEVTEENAGTPPYPYPGAVTSPAETTKTGTHPDAATSEAESSEADKHPLEEFMKWKNAIAGFRGEEKKE